jgi:predicted dehydrogenase
LTGNLNPLIVAGNPNDVRYRTGETVMSKRVSRRGFLKRGSAVLGGAVIAPNIAHSSVLGADGATPPNDRITMGAIGVGGMGRHDLGNFLTHPDLHVLAVCDVDTGRRNNAKKMVDEHYGNQDCMAYPDWRDVIASDDLDAILIATPDHWHALISIAAAKAGKDVYCEKPISLTIAEGRVVADVTKRYGTVYQSGTQRRSIPCFAFPVEVARSGKIGEVHTIHTNLMAGPTCGVEPIQPVPEGFDYDMWLGPAPYEPYTTRRRQGTFRWLWDYSGGKLTDIGAHFNDLAQWGNDSELTGPVSYEGWSEFPKEGLFETPTNYEVTCTYADGVKLIMHSEELRLVRFEGTEGWISVDDTGKVEASPESLLSEYRHEQQNYDVMYRHHRNFLDCVKSREDPISNAEVSHRSSTVCHAGNICLRLGRGLHWDPDAEHFIGDDEANRMMARSMRAPWHL